MIHLVVVALLASCSFPIDSDPQHPITVGNISITRPLEAPERFQLDVTVYNGTPETLIRFEVKGCITTSIPNPDEGNDGERTVATAIALFTDCEIGPQTTRSIELTIPPPFPFIPERPIELSALQFHSFVNTDGDVLDEVIHFPYTVKEEI
jgi:hypothetical protein